MARKFLEEALRAAEIVNNSFRVDKRNTRHVVPVKLENKSLGYHVTTITKIPGQRARRHLVKVYPQIGYKGRFNACPHILVDCDCQRFLFVWNFALMKHDAAIDDRTNGEPPIVTNPEQIPGACKHSIVALRLLAKQNPTFITQEVPNARSGREHGSIPLTSLNSMLKRIRKGSA